LIEKGAILGTALNQFQLPIVLCCFYRAKKIFHYPTFVTNVEQKMANRSFTDDVRGLIRTGTSLDWSAACERVFDYYVFLDDLDDRDRRFLDLTKDLLRKPYPEATVELIKDLQHPLTPITPTQPIPVIPVDLTPVIPTLSRENP